MEEYIYREGCYPKGCQMEGWQWGKKIRIWQDHWLPRKHPFLLFECPIVDYEDSTVDVLIDPHSRQWNKELVDGLFNEEEAELIKKISLS